MARVGWGYDAFGQASPPSGLTDVTAISAGGWDSLAIVSSVTQGDSLGIGVFVGPATTRTLVYPNGPAMLTSGDYAIDPATGQVTSDASALARSQDASAAPRR